MRNRTKFGIAAAVIGIVSLLIGHFGGPTYAANIDNTPDCDNVAIFYCGSMNESEFHRKWNNDGRYNDHQAVFAAFGINKDDVNGMVDGVVWKDGRVTLNDGKVVATGAMTAGRNWGGNPIPNTKNAAKYSTSKFVTEGQTAMIKMVDGQFKFAVVKSCGNPVTATPVEQPKPEPKPEPRPEPTPEKPPVKNIKVCDLTTKEVITIKEDNFDADKHSKDLADCDEEITVCDLEKLKVVTIKEEDFDSSKHSRDLKDCEPKKPEPKNIQVCDLATTEIVTIEEDDFDSDRHSKDLADCETPEPTKITVCNVNTKKIVEIDDTDFNKTIHTTDLSKCEEKPEKPAPPVEEEKPADPEPVAELPQTGPMDGLFNAIGLASLTASTIAFVSSRRLV